MDAQPVNRASPGLRTSSCAWAQWPQLRDRWAELARGSTQPSFFLTAEWVDTWLAVFGDVLQPQFLLFEEDEMLLGACVLVGRRHRYGPVSARRIYLNMAGEESGDGTCIEFNDLVCRPGQEATVAAALFSYLQERRWDEFVLAGFQSGAGLDALQSAFGALPWQIVEKPSYYVDLSRVKRSGKAYDLAISSNTRRQIRRSCELYKQEGTITVECAEDVETALRLLCELAELHQKTWIARGKPGVFRSEKFTTFHRSLIRRVFTQGSIQLLAVRAGEQTIGILYNFVYAGKVYFYQSGFHYTEDNRYKPGMVTHFYAIQHCLAQGYKEYDFLAGDSQYKRSLATDDRKLQWIVIERNTLATRAVRLLRKVKQRCAQLRAYPNREVPPSR
jgi:hypothetical protein